MEPILNELPCWETYKSYTATNNIPKVLRETSAVVNLTLAEPVEDAVEEVEETEDVEQEIEA